MASNELRATARNLNIPDVDFLTDEQLEEAIEFRIHQTVDNPDLIDKIASYLNFEDLKVVRSLTRTWKGITHKRFDKMKAPRCDWVWVCVIYRWTPHIAMLRNSLNEAREYIQRSTSEVFEENLEARQNVETAFAETSDSIWLVYRQNLHSKSMPYINRSLSSTIRDEQYHAEDFPDEEHYFQEDDYGKTWFVYKPILNHTQDGVELTEMVYDEIVAEDNIMVEDEDDMRSVDDDPYDDLGVERRRWYED